MTKWIVENFSCEFKIEKQSDGSGTHMTVYLETQKDITDKIKTLPLRWLGWRVIFIKCPIGYIRGILK